MEQKTGEFSQAKSKMASDIKTVITDGEDLLKAAASASGAGFAAARGRLVDASRPAVDQARMTAAAANGYVHGNPWTAVGIAAVAGVLIGFLVTRR